MLVKPSNIFQCLVKPMETLKNKKNTFFLASLGSNFISTKNTIKASKIN